MNYDYNFYEQFIYTFLKSNEGITLEELVILLVEIYPIIEEEKLLRIIDTMAAKEFLLYQKNEEGFTELFINCYEESLLSSIF